MKHSVYLYVGSFGDLYDIASFLPCILDARPEILILADSSFRDVLRVFLGEHCVSERILFLSEFKLHRVRHLIGLGSPHLENQKCSTFRNPGIRSSIFPDNPREWYAFNHCNEMKNSLYASIFKIDSMLLPRAPAYISESEVKMVNELTKGLDAAPSCLINPKANTHLSLTFDQWVKMLVCLSTSGIHPICNVYGLNYSERNALGRYADCIEIPGHLMSYIINRFDCVAGPMGGAIGVAYDFTDTNISTFLTPDIHCTTKVYGPVGECYLQRMGCRVIEHDNSRETFVLDALHETVAVTEDILTSFMRQTISSTMSGFQRRRTRSLS